jgi:hypothetical protein
MKDKVTVTLTFEREINGTISHKITLDGEGFHYFELIGLLQITCYKWAEQSSKTANEVPKEENVRLKFVTDKSGL